MPTYEYHCLKCDGIFEKTHPITNPPKVRCWFCNSKKVQKLISNVNVAFKGPGFTRNLLPIELGDGRRGSVNEDGFERIRKIDPDAKLIKV